MRLYNEKTMMPKWYTVIAIGMLSLTILTGMIIMIAIAVRWVIS